MSSPMKPDAARTPRRLGVAGVCLLALVLGGCYRFGLDPPPVQQVSLTTQSVPPETRREDPAVAREHTRILAAYGGAYENPRLHALISRTVKKLVAASERPDMKYRITILNSPAVNAFALPSGQLYVTRGLIALSNDTSELASVLSHEMAHVIAHHAAIRAEQVRQAAIVSRVVNDVLSDPQTGALAIAKSKLALASFSRAQEFEADAIGVAITSRAGYDPYGAVRFLTEMQHNAEIKHSGAGAVRPLDFLASHPATPERIRNARAKARQFTAPGAGARDKSTYLASLDGLVFGEDPSEGFVRGRRFLHPKLGFTFTAPVYFTLDNTAHAVLGVKRGGGQALRVDVVKVPAEQTLSQYLNSGWIDKVDATTVSDLSINGFPAATAIARGDKWSFRLFAVRFGSEVYRFIFATKNLTPAVDQLFRRSVGTFRRMSLTETESARPLRIKIVTVKRGDTVKTLARRMAVDSGLARFRVLNGLGLRDKVKVGDKVKIVLE